MSNPLYFVSVLVEALHHPEPRRSLHDAFVQIRQMGAQAEHREGLLNFKYFMDIACSYADMIGLDAARERVAELVTTGREAREHESELLSGLHPAWKAEYEQICAEQAGQSASGESRPIIGVFDPQGKIGDMIFEGMPGRVVLDGISPGTYVLKLLNTGRVLWEGELAAEDLIWTTAYEGRDLKLAAKTSGVQGKPTHQWSLSSGQMILRTFAGVENGTIELELTR